MSSLRGKGSRVTRVLLIVAAVLIALFVATVFVARRLVRRAARRMGGWQARLIQLRQHVLPPGPRRDAARLRARLHAELRATREMLGAAPQGLIFRADAGSVLHELASTAAELDRELAAVERFLDNGQQQAALRAVRPQVEQLIDTTYTARQTILRTAVADRERQLSNLRDAVAGQAAALDTYRTNGRELSL
jgi:hypothetical protein